MRVERQGPDECMLATLAALADTTLAHVRALSGVPSWADDVIGWPGRYQDATDRLCVALRLPQIVLSGPTGSVAPFLPRTGRGYVHVGRVTGWGHIMPWEDGRLCDPEDPLGRWRTLAEWLAARPGYTVLRVQTIGRTIP